MAIQQQARPALEHRLAPWRALTPDSTARPSVGWVRTIRDAREDLVARIGTQRGLWRAVE